MTLLAPIMLWGLAAAAVPLVIHLLNRPRYRVERWGATMFLRAAVLRRSRRIKLKQWLLLLVRTAVLVLLALALTRPADPARGGGDDPGGDPLTHVLVFDGSYSMRAGELREQAFAKARAAALEIVARMNEGDNALLLWAGNKPRALTPKPVFDRTELARRIESLQPGWESADWPKALEQAVWLLEQGAHPRRRVYLLTDGQAAGWAPDDTARWRDAAARFNAARVKPTLYALPQAPALAPVNGAITDLRTRFALLDIHRPSTLLADIDLQGAGARTVEARLRVDGRTVETRPLELRRGLNPVEFNHTFGEEGYHAIELDIGEDDLAPDNRRQLAVQVLRTFPVLIVDGRPPALSPRVPPGGATLLRWALEAGGDTNGVLFACATRPATDLDQMSAADLLPYRAVVLCDVPTLPSPFIGTLERYVKDGGGLLVTAGARVAPESFNRLCAGTQGILPARLGAPHKIEDDATRPTFPAGVAPEVLSQMDLARTRRWSDVRVSITRETEPVEGARVVAQLDARPWLATLDAGLGSAVLLTTSLDLEECNVAATPDFVPFMHSLLYYLCSRVVPPVNLAQGEMLVYSYARAVLDARPARQPAASGTVPGICQVVTPAGVTNTVRLQSRLGEPVAYWPETYEPGIYRVEAAGAPPRYYTINVPAAEAAPRPLAGGERRVLGKRLPLSFVEDPAALWRAVQREAGVRDITGALTWLALMALMADLVLQWKFSE